ncbi:hypothetical protein SAMN05518865_12327 [Duganella sp. CF458]|uniref:hypothetical protein n=1 Tax=Duganella sp. CF458 TaxID=1884368 RepID=UPI0008F181FF|nr:hypothetical protein [Duganella sp. CF458]SFG92244.1 hypothetical protein SAMN05518865_12327 [Duganella sp. CF458]
MPICRIAIVSAALALTTACSVNRPVADDYGTYLGNNVKTGNLPSARIADRYYLPPATQAHRYEFKSVMGGYANTWVVEFGKVLDATMRSSDVVAALGSVSKAGNDKSGSGNTLVFELQRYTFEDHGAHLELAISIRNAKGEVFRKVYDADGRTQGGKMFWGGAFAMKNAVQQSTKLAMDDILVRFIRDAASTSLASTRK